MCVVVVCGRLFSFINRCVLLLLVGEYSVSQKCAFVAISGGLFCFTDRYMCLLQLVGDY